MNLCIVIPAYNEEPSIGETIREYKAVFPDARIVVVDNNSTDNTHGHALEELDPASDLIVMERRQGKGFAVKTGLSRLEADIYIVTDGDAAFPAVEARKLVDEVLKTRLDMAVGDRVSGGAYQSLNVRAGHGWGNSFLTFVISTLAGEPFKDVLSGLRVMSRPYVAALDVRSEGFQIEAEMNILAAYLRAHVAEIPVALRDRKEGTHSKLNTVRDGFRILNFALTNWIAFSPMQPFMLLFALSSFVTLFLAYRFIMGFVEVGLPFTTTATMGVTSGLVAILALFFGIALRILGRNDRRREIAQFLEAKRKWNSKLDAERL